jgi:lysophospholipase L1-like esterase
MFGQLLKYSRRIATYSRRIAALSVALALNLAACGDDAPGVEDTGVSSPPQPAQGSDGAAPVANPTGTTDSASPAVVATDAGTRPGADASVDAAAPMDGSITIITPIEPQPEGGSVVTPEDASVATSDAGDAGPPRWSTREDLGKGDGKDVITIGDSWMAGPLNGAGIQAGLDREGTDYRHYAVTATTLLSGQIPGQYDRAKRANPKISTVIMTAGGNDVMFSGGCNTKAECQVISDKISDGLDKLWSQMAADGVQDVVYIQYANVAGATPTELRGMAKPVAVCYSGKINCHSMETSSIVTKSSDLTDGIHPDTAANTRIAKAVLALMEARKIRR